VVKTDRQDKSIMFGSIGINCRLVSLAFLASTGITLLVLGCALPEYRWVDYVYMYISMLIYVYYWYM